MRTYTLKIVDIRYETEDTLTLCFKQPGLRKIKYWAGQYLTLIFRINGRKYIRPYSFSSAPSVDPLLEVTIKRVVNGIVSNHIHDQVKIGDVLEVLEPMGDFTLNQKEKVNTIFFWGVGSGVTPLMSLIKEVLYTGLEVKAILIYGNRNFESTIFGKILNEMLIAFPNRFKIWHFHTQISIRQDSQDIIEGRINKDYALDILSSTDFVNSRHYICGPTGLKESVKEALSILNVPENNILSEDFELIKDPNDFKDIKTENIQLRFQGQHYTLEVIKGRSILESALDLGLELPYSCQTGNCSTCKAICLKGEVKMIGLTKERIDLKETECLLCCSHPLTKNVYIEI